MLLHLNLKKFEEFCYPKLNHLLGLNGVWNTWFKTASHG